MIEALKQFFETELFYTRVGLNKETDPVQRNNIAWYCVQRCLGATQFASQLGADSATVGAMFEGVKEELRAMGLGV